MKKNVCERFALIIAILLCLTGCGTKSKTGWLRDRSEDYRHVQSCPCLQLPTGYHAEPFSEEYQIPDTP